MAYSTTKVRGLTIAASVAFHAVLTAGLFHVAHLADGTNDEAPPPETRSEGATAGAIAIELPQAGEGDWVDQRPADEKGEVPRVAGGDVVARLDTGAPPDTARG